MIVGHQKWGVHGVFHVLPQINEKFLHHSITITSHEKGEECTTTATDSTVTQDQQTWPKM